MLDPVFLFAARDVRLDEVSRSSRTPDGWPRSVMCSLEKSPSTSRCWRAGSSCCDDHPSSRRARPDDDAHALAPTNVATGVVRTPAGVPCVGVRADHRCRAQGECRD